jgi:uncharacterized protein YjbI with pentapeptide repeats
MNVDLPAASRAAAALLQGEVVRMRARGIPVGEDDLRGLYISDQEADRIVATAGEPGPPREPSPHEAALIDALGPRLLSLSSKFGLSEPEIGLVGLCLVAETNPEIERLIAYVQDDVSKKRIRAEVGLRLFFGYEPAAQTAFDLDRPLRKFHLLELHDEPGQAATPLMARSITLSQRVARFLLGGDALEEQLAYTATFAALSAEPDDAPLNPADLSPAVLNIRGTDLAKVRRTAESLAAAAHLTGVVELTLTHLPELPARTQFELGARDAALASAAFLVRGIEALEEPLRPVIIGQLDSCVAPLTLLVTQNEPGWPGPSLTISNPSFETRLAEWRAELATLKVEPGLDEALTALAGKFELDTTAIAAGARTALGLATTRDAAHPVITVEDLYAAARARSAPILSALAQKVADHKRWEDLILEPDPLSQLRELCGMVEHRHRVYDEWGFGKKLSNGKGVVSLFAGQSGTGKTMAAGVISAELGLDLYRIDLSGVVSKYIGETEKNLGAIFREASLSNAILFFDEADALFGKRSEVKDAHDRYANIETAYLLQQIEEYSGPVILSTNLKMNLDEAFLRRMHFVVDFPMPEEAYRLRIWQTTIPREVPLAADANLAFLARQFRISGGNIRNIVLAAAFLAAADGDEVCMKHLIRGTRREFQKLGRMVTEADFGEYIVHLE